LSNGETFTLKVETGQSDMTTFATATTIKKAAGNFTNGIEAKVV